MRRKRKYHLSPELEPLARMIEDLGDRYDTHSVFRDFVEMGAIALAKPDLKQACAREERYLSLIRQYKNPEECQAFPKMFGELVMALAKTGQDVLGPISAALSLPTKSGQVWTPHTISYMMAEDGHRRPESLPRPSANTASLTCLSRPAGRAA